ncbi:homeodomain-like protein [Tanacetum coccineum]|uniref:Homeodomain-like protein n=1 Tax=Tanacetum coccineum TaxID=301880 RepID=A0ABQ5I7Y7_9ASTR
MMVKSISTIVEADSILNTYESSQYAGSPGQNYTMYETKQTTIMFPSRLNGYYCKERRDHMDHNSWKLTQSFIYLIIPYPEKRKTQGVSLYFALLINVCFDNALADLELCDNGRDIGVNRSLDPFFDDYIELNNLNVPLELRRDQVDDSMPTIEEGEEFRTRNDARMVSKFIGYPSDCDHDKKIRIDCAQNLKFYCMIGFEFLHANFFPILYVNVMSKKFYNSIMKDKLEYKGNNVVGALMNIPIFVGTFSILIDFAVLEDMDAYRDKGMDDVILGEPFFREVRINVKWFEGMITFHNGNEEVTYLIVRSHPRFKHHTNEQCNKILPLLKVSEGDKMNGISHSYQKFRGFYKGDLELRA